MTMTRRFPYGHKLAAALAGFSLCACAEEPAPQEQTPVDPEPGLYEVSVSNGFGGARSKSEKTVTTCLRESGRAAFAHMLAENYFLVSGACRPERLPREGNAVAGEIICAADPRLATGTNSFIYDGVVAADSVSLEARIKFDATMKEGASEISPVQMKLAMKTLEQLRSLIDAKRIGECR